MSDHVKTGELYTVHGIHDLPNESVVMVLEGSDSADPWAVVLSARGEKIVLKKVMRALR